MSDRSLGRTLWTLCLALLNATLILVAICLWFGWRLADTVQNISTEVSRTVGEARPMKDEFSGLTAEVSALRAELASLRDGTGGITSQAAQRYEHRLEEISGKLSSTGQRLNAMLQDPDALIETAIGAAADELTGFVVGIRDCQPEERT